MTDATIMTIEVHVLDGDQPKNSLEEDPLWTLSIEIGVPSLKLKYRFDVEEPYLYYWDPLLAGQDTHMSLYSGNGDGSISLKNGTLTFVAAPSGGGGDVTGTFEVPAEQVLDRLRKAFADRERDTLRGRGLGGKDEGKDKQ